jgi:hypothetical protein
MFFTIKCWASPLIVVLMLASGVACGQDETDANGQSASVTKPDALNFTELVQKRDELQVTVKTLTDQISYLREIDYMTQQLKIARGEEKQRLLKQVSEYEYYAGLVQGDAARLDIPQEMKKKQHDLDEATNARKVIESKINHVLNIDFQAQEFKKSVSYVFAGIVFAVIVGFFLVAISSPKVKEEIFKGQSGIQFITLFSLVIAIILFGICGILGGRELSALLGGIAGYILGRTGSEAIPRAQEQPESPKPLLEDERQVAKEETNVKRAA